MPGWSLPAQLPPVMARSMAAGPFPGSSLIVPSSTLPPWSRVYLSPLNDHVAVMPIGRPSWTQDSTFHSPSSFERSFFGPLRAGAGRAVGGPARRARTATSHRGRFIGHLRGLPARYMRPPGEGVLWFGQTRSFVGDTPMKWVSILAVAALVFMVLWHSGYVEQFLGPWASWTRFIGYFQ